MASSLRLRRCARGDQVGSLVLAGDLPYVPLAAALRDALTQAELSKQHRPGLRMIVPELTPADPPAKVAEIDVLEALFGILAEHAPLVLLFGD